MIVGLSLAIVRILIWQSVADRRASVSDDRNEKNTVGYLIEVKKIMRTKNRFYME